MWRQTVLTERLDLSVPIIQGPFGGGLSSVELAGLVSEAGGLGSFGAHHLPPEQIRAVARAIRERTDRPFALNIWIPLSDREPRVSNDDPFRRNVDRLKPYYDELGLPPPERPDQFWPRYEEQIEAILEVRPPVFSFVYGVPATEVLDRCRKTGIRTIGTATTVEEARQLDRAGVDAVVATGFEAGGHRVSFLRPPEQCLTGTLALVPQVVDAVRCPVIAAGGIADGRGIAAAISLGAAGVQIGTAFLACRESAASATHREALFGPNAGETALTRAFTGRLARGIRNRFMEEMTRWEDDLPPYPIQNWFTAPIKAAAVKQGRPELMSLWAGQSAPLLSHRDARSLIESLTEQTDRILTR